MYSVLFLLLINFGLTGGLQRASDGLNSSFHFLSQTFVSDYRSEKEAHSIIDGGVSAWSDNRFYSLQMQTNKLSAAGNY